MVTMTELAEMVRDLPADATCPLCHNRGLITCPEHGAELGKEGWCVLCDAEPDEPAELITCPCQDD